MVQHVQNVGEGGQRLDARVPVGLRLGAGRNLIGRTVALRAHLIDPLIGDGHLRRIRGGGENLRQQRVGIERDRRQKLFQILRAQGLNGRGGLRGILLLRIGRSGRVRLLCIRLLRVRLLGSVWRLLILWLGVAILRGGLSVLAARRAQPDRAAAPQDARA